MKVKIWKISQINSYIKSIIDSDVLLNSFFAEGEISNLKFHTSGHIYFTLKDEKSSINCVMFKIYAESINFQLNAGMKVIVCGYVSFYDKTGQVQIYTEMIEPIGLGRLYANFEQLKAKLFSEGLFENKRPLPPYPKCVAVITSETGAAVHDIIRIIRRRNKGVKIVIFPSLVQGAEAPSEIVSAIKRVNAWGKADVIILGRGGGSVEDLAAFNDELVARAIHFSKIPVISAVGHEIDFTIADFAADLRAPTPSAAAELAVPEISQIASYHRDLTGRLDLGMLNKLDSCRQIMDNLLKRKVMKDPFEVPRLKKNRLENLYRILNKDVLYVIEKNMLRLTANIKSLENTSPLNVILRGYTLAFDMDGKAVTSVENISVHDQLKFKFKDGDIYTEVKDTEPCTLRCTHEQ